MKYKIGDKGRYAFFSNIELVEILEDTVIIKDSKGDTKKIYKSLFIKHFTKG